MKIFDFHNGGLGLGVRCLGRASPELGIFASGFWLGVLYD